MIYADRTSHRSTLYVTSDGGVNWNPILQGSSLKSIYQFDKNNIIVGYQETGIASTSNGGASWSFENFGKSEASVRRIDFANNNYGWVCTYKSVFITTDGGSTWSETGIEKGWYDALSIDIVGVGKGWLVKEDGKVYKYNSGLNSWEELGRLGGTCYGDNAGITFADSSTAYAVGLNKSYKSTDGGLSWSSLSFLVNKDIYDYQVLSSNSIFTCGQRGIHHSGDGGDTFDPQFTEDNTILSISFISSSTGWAVTEDMQMLKTTNDGDNWEKINWNLEYPPEIISVVDKPNDDGGFVNLTFQRSELDGIVNSEVLLRYEIFMLKNNYLSYLETVTPQSQSNYTVELKSDGDFTDDDKIWTYYKVKAYTDQNNIYESSVKGGYSIDNLAPQPPENIIAELINGKVYLSWRSSKSEDVEKYQVFKSYQKEFDFDTLNVYAEISDTSYVDANIQINESDTLYYAVSCVDDSDNQGNIAEVVAVPIITTSVDKKLPRQFSLSQNYPNPFNPSTTIKFTMPSNLKNETQDIKLVVYDVLGRDIKVLINEKLSSGAYEINFNAENLPSGIYFYTLNVADKFTSTKKMLLIK